MNVRDRIALLDKVDRSVKLAGTYLRKATDAIHWYEERPLLPSYWRLLDETLDAALEIIEALPDDFFETYTATAFIDGQPFKNNLSDGPLETAAKVLAAIEARRGGAKRQARIRALEDTTGRTAAEAASYRAKAEELRRSGT